MLLWIIPLLADFNVSDVEHAFTLEELDDVIISDVNSLIVASQTSNRQHTWCMNAISQLKMSGA